MAGNILVLDSLSINCYQQLAAKMDHVSDDDCVIVEVIQDKNLIVSDTDKDFQYRPKAKIKIVGDEINDLVENSSDEDYSNKPALKKLKAEVNMDLFEDGNHASNPVLINNSDKCQCPHFN